MEPIFNFTLKEKERMEKDLVEADKQIKELEKILHDARFAYNVIEQQYKVFLKAMKKSGSIM